MRKSLNNYPEYFNHISKETEESLYRKIKKLLHSGHVYRNKDYTARAMAKSLNTNTRFVTIVIRLRYGMSYSTLINKLRTEEACEMLSDPHFDALTLSEIAAMVGFANKQSFYLSFKRVYGTTPLRFRKEKKLLTLSDTQDL